jgi:hypothetical protein
MLRLLLTICVFLAGFNLAYASPSEVRQIKNSVTRIKQEERKITSSFKKLSARERDNLKKTTRGLDSDGDGLADTLEPALGSNRCDADSDDDGLDDDQDQNENEKDSNDNGVPDGSEVETKGRIASFNDPILVIGTTTLKITAATVFFRGLSSKSDLVAGTCVEAEGRRNGSEILVDKIKKKRDSDCGGSGSGDD